MFVDEFCTRHCAEVERANRIDQEFYKKYNVKRGLRNEDGTGVLVGLTRVSHVKGYDKKDGKATPCLGRLFYRNIEIKDLVRGFETEDRFGYEEIVYLLIFGSLPTRDRLAEMNRAMADVRAVRKNFPRDVLQTFRTPNIMNALARSVLTLYGIDEHPEDLSIPNQVRQSLDLVAKVATLVPYAYYSIQHGFYNRSLIIHTPDPSLSTAQNFLRLLRPDSKFTDIEAKTLDVCLVLHADHGGGNNSTFTTRVVTSTMTDMYSAIAAAIGSLKGPLHGGANEKVYEMMKDLRANVPNPKDRDQVRAYLFKLLQKDAFDRQGKIYGVGHAVYSLSDPRADVLREYARRLAIAKGREDEFAAYELVEQEGPDVLRTFRNDPDMTVSSNVDFYSGFVYDCLEIPLEVFTAMFAIARVAGWCAHRVELLSNPVKLTRPGFQVLGEPMPYVPLAERG